LVRNQSLSPLSYCEAVRRDQTHAQNGAPSTAMMEEMAPEECEYDEYGFLCVGRGPHSNSEDGDFRCHDYHM